ncbi:hypothetical protein JIR001_26090 [Polycladomyces abyssicola]|uniref:Uncharacterized protein n=1 Tax=Polycladomyces abyssicola TaxID=1125966 RepID=A0A8D5UFY2_9BACL|nr:hypothetical protein [Polycladomyces abyssicola]BCU82826.1 hypothetical protein JIR001_26090 [Polycladomyces abyssicola]
MMKQRFLFIYSIMLIFLCFVMFSAPVYAADHSIVFSLSDDKTMFSHQTVDIPEHKTIDHVVEIGGDVNLAGSVHEIIVIGGDLHIKKTAHVRDLVFVIGGSVTQEPGAKVTDEIISFAFDHQIANSILIAGTFLLGLWFFQISITLLLFVLPIGTAILAKHRIDPFMTRIRFELKRMILIGIVTSIMLIAIAFLLTISIIGIPLLIVLYLLLLIFSIISLTAISLIIGEQIPLSVGQERWLTAAIGSAIVTSLINFPILGWFLLLGLHWLSLGLMICWLWEKRVILIKPKK